MTRHTYDTDIEIAGLTVPVSITFDFKPGFDGDEIDRAVQPMAAYPPQAIFIRIGNLSIRVGRRTFA